MNTTQVWTTSVVELLSIFREGLVAMVPIAEKARIPWRDGEAYDDWDGIASALYTNIVVRGIDDSLGTPFGAGMPRYDTQYDSYAGFRYIVLEDGGVPPGVLGVFLGFAGVSPDFANVKWLELSAAGTVRQSPIRVSAFRESRYSIVHGTELGLRTRDLVIRL